MPEVSDKRPLKVFLCHAHADRDTVRALYTRLTKDGVDAWLDKEKLLPGQDWELEIRRAVREADVVVVCLSKQFNRAGFRQKEVRLALDTAMEKPEGEIFIIPARLEECDNLESLRKWQWVDLFEEDGYERLMGALQARAYRIGTTLQAKRGRSSKDNSPRTKFEERQEDKPKETPISHAAADTFDQKEQIPFEPINIKSNSAIMAGETKKEESSSGDVRQIVEKTTIDVAKPAPKKQRRDWNARIVVVLIVIIVTICAAFVALPSLANLFSRTPTSSYKTPLPYITPAPSLFSTETIDAKGISMMSVPAGEFTMGDDYQGSETRPLHKVFIDAFYIDKYEVTNALYKACVSEGACQSPKSASSSSRSSYYDNSDFDNFPVINVDWDMAEAYCEWRGAHLPTEAQWEKAARGTDERTYPWGEGINCNTANYKGSACVGGISKVGSYDSGVSPYGVYDMAGNVWEWVADWYAEGYYESSATNPIGPQTGKYRVLRGGSWENSGNDARVYVRLATPQSNFWESWGFRCVRSAP